MSLNTIAHGTAARQHLRRDLARSVTAVARVSPRTWLQPMRISIGSMQILETSLALGAIATALLIGAGR